MPKRSIRDGCLLLLGRREARAYPAPVPAHADYAPTAWFGRGWELIVAAKREQLERLLAGTYDLQDAAELACLQAGLAYLQGDPRASEAHASTALAARPAAGRF